jgi:predicted RNase H-related nuclease YkuK (DUF458 family)
MKTTSHYKHKDWLASIVSVVTIVGAIAGAFIFLDKTRDEAIENNRKNIARTWTNEGDISSQETRFIDLMLENYDGDIIGTLTSPSLAYPLDVHIDIGWFSSELTIIKLNDRTVSTVATVNLKITGNNNRLEWNANSSSLPEYLPITSKLWPKQVLTH